MGSNFRLVVYYGLGRQMRHSAIKTSHAVLTTYSVLTSEWRSRKSATANGKFNLLSLMWHRIVLDEGETRYPNPYLRYLSNPVPCKLTDKFIPSAHHPRSHHAECQSRPRRRCSSQMVHHRDPYPEPHQRHWRPRILSESSPLRRPEKV